MSDRSAPDNPAKPSPADAITMNEAWARLQERTRVRESRLIELAARLNGESLMRQYLNCNGQGSDSIEWDTVQFERWLIGVMRKALREASAETPPEAT